MSGLQNPNMQNYRVAEGRKFFCGILKERKLLRTLNNQHCFKKRMSHSLQKDPFPPYSNL